MNELIIFSFIALVIDSFFVQFFTRYRNNFGHFFLFFTIPAHFGMFLPRPGNFSLFPGVLCTEVVAILRPLFGRT